MFYKLLQAISLNGKTVHASKREALFEQGDLWSGSFVDSGKRKVPNGHKALAVHFATGEVMNLCRII